MGLDLNTFESGLLLLTLAGGLIKALAKAASKDKFISQSEVMTRRLDLVDVIADYLLALAALVAGGAVMTQETDSIVPTFVTILVLAAAIVGVSCMRRNAKRDVEARTAAQPTDPAAQPTDPAAQPTDPAAQPTELPRGGV